jgi:hypothetical protein
MAREDVMKSPLNLWIVSTLLLVSCASGTPSASAPGASPNPTPAAARTIVASIPSEGIGNIAVRIAIPHAGRYATGAGVVVILSPILTASAGFQSDPDVTGLGLIGISYLWPGQQDTRARVRSDGRFDYGGPASIQALRDVIRFACGLNPDKDGHFLSDLTGIPALTQEVGLYAYGEAGMAAVDVLSAYGDKMLNVLYFIGRENPTSDTLADLELGYWDSNGLAVINPLYQYPQDYAPGGINLSYTNLRWAATYKDSQSAAAGRPYLDLDGDGQISAGDFVFSGQVPVISGERYYSTALTAALLTGGALTPADWPADVATPAATAQFWQARQSVTQYQFVRNKTPALKVMLVFAVDDSLQVARDKPHVHQAFQGFRFETTPNADVVYPWVRLNPDRAYVQAFIPEAGLDFPDNPADTQPDDWTQVGKYAYPGGGQANRLVPLAALAEMADRAHDADWRLNLGQVLYPSLNP